MNRAPITFALIIINVVMYLVQLRFDENTWYPLALWPFGTPLFHPWQLVTYAFLHGGYLHLFTNMFALYMFGPDIEWLLGVRRFLIYYFVCVIGAAALHMAITALNQGEFAPIVGASGGIFGILLAFGMAFPRRRLMLLFPPIPMPAWLFVTLYGLLELGLGVTNTLPGIAHFAHLGGMAAGFLLLMYWRRMTR